MDDAEYARQLEEILTAPPGPEMTPGGLGDDGIDRCDGFGTVVKVSSIAVVPGDHGSQIDVTFVLDLPGHIDVPRVGSLLLPFEAEWREVSGFAEPEDYAPRIAMRLVLHIHEHIRAHESSRDDEPDLPARAEQHAMLLQVLGQQGEVEQQAADRYVVRNGGREDLVVLLTPDQWERVVRRHGPGRAHLLEHFDELLAATPREERFLVFWEGDATTSMRERLPPVTRPFPSLRETRRRLDEARASGQCVGWFAYRPGPRD